MNPVYTPDQLRNTTPAPSLSLQSLIDAINHTLRDRRRRVLRGHWACIIQIDEYSADVVEAASVEISASGWSHEIYSFDGHRFLEIGLESLPADAGIPDDELIEIMVGRQSRQFYRAIDGLMKDHEGKWCVWLDGPLGFFDTMNDALGWAYKNLDVRAGFCCAVVEPQRVCSI